MKALFLSTFILFSCTLFAQETDTIHISKLDLGVNKKKVFSGRDSSLIISIDTLIMKKKSQLVFFGKKDVKLNVAHAQIDNRVFILGSDGKNNGTDFDINIRFEELGTLFVGAAGQDANNNGSRTFPNGDGGDINLTYDAKGIVPQQEDKKAPHYLVIENRAGGYRVNAQNEINNIYSLIRAGSSSRPLGSLAQGQVYSGSPGKDGKSNVKAKD